MVRISMSALAIFIASTTLAQQIPNGHLQVAYRDRKDGATAGGFHELDLGCNNNLCEAVTVTITDCVTSAFGSFAVMQLTRTSTTDRDLVVTASRPGALEVRESADDAEFTYTISYTSVSDKAMRRAFHTRSNQFFIEATGFSGVGVGHDSHAKSKVISWELVPMKWGNARVKIDCPVQLHGVR